MTYYGIGIGSGIGTGTGIWVIETLPSGWQDASVLTVVLTIQPPSTEM